MLRKSTGLPFPNHYRYGDGLSEAAFVERELCRFRESLVNTVAAEQVAAVILEPVQGEGGFVPVPAGLLAGSAKALRRTRHSADPGRSAIGFLSHGSLGSLRTLRCRAGYLDMGQIDGRRLADRRGHRQGGRHGRSSTGNDRRHLRRQPGRLCRVPGDNSTDGGVASGRAGHGHRPTSHGSLSGNCSDISAVGSATFVVSVRWWAWSW